MTESDAMEVAEGILRSFHFRDERDYDLLLRCIITKAQKKRGELPRQFINRFKAQGRINGEGNGQARGGVVDGGSAGR